MDSETRSPATSWLLVFRVPLLTFAFSLGCFVIDGPIELPFFEAAAQILPVLVLALALEFRFFTPGTRPGTGDVLDVTFLFFILAWGEWIALDVLGGNAASEAEGTIVAAAILTGFVGVAVGALTANATPPPYPRWAARLFRRPESGPQRAESTSESESDGCS